MHNYKVGGQPTLTIPGTNIQIPLGPAQSNTQQQPNQNQQSSTVQNQQNNQQNNVQSSSANQSNSNQAQQQQQQTIVNGQNQNQQQQNTVITMPNGTNIQIPANFAGKFIFIWFIGCMHLFLFFYTLVLSHKKIQKLF